MVKRCITRTSDILYRHNIAFAMKRTTFATVANTPTYDVLPVDYGVDGGLYRTDTYKRLDKIDFDQWEQLNLISQMSVWMIDEDEDIAIKGTPTSVVTMALWYWPEIAVSAYTTGTTMPWSGRVDEIIIEYMVNRLRANDEYDITQFDNMLMSEIQQNRLNKWRRWNYMNPGVVPFVRPRRF